MTDGSIYLTTRNRGHISIELEANDIELLKNIQEKIPDSKLNTRIRNTNFKENCQTCNNFKVNGGVCTGTWFNICSCYNSNEFKSIDDKVFRKLK